MVGELKGEKVDNTNEGLERIIGRQIMAMEGSFDANSRRFMDNNYPGRLDNCHDFMIPWIRCS